MAPSTTSTSISTFLMSHGTLLVLEPRRQTNADLKSANEVLVLIHEMVLAYCSPFLMAISCAKRLWYFKHSFPIPPVVLKTKGVNVPCYFILLLLVIKVRLRVMESPNARDQSAFCVFHTFSVEIQTNASYIQSCDACVITTWGKLFKAGLR